MSFSQEHMEYFQREIDRRYKNKNYKIKETEHFADDALIIFTDSNEKNTGLYSIHEGQLIAPVPGTITFGTNGGGFVSAAIVNEERMCLGSLLAQSERRKMLAKSSPKK